MLRGRKGKALVLLVLTSEWSAGLPWWPGQRSGPPLQGKRSPTRCVLWLGEREREREGEGERDLDREREERGGWRERERERGSSNYIPSSPQKRRVQTRLERGQSSHACSQTG